MYLPNNKCRATPLHAELRECSFQPTMLVLHVSQKLFDALNLLMSTEPVVLVFSIDVVGYAIRYLSLDDGGHTQNPLEIFDTLTEHSDVYES